jgi:PST family polysaccharide transporter
VATLDGRLAEKNARVGQGSDPKDGQDSSAHDHHEGRGGGIIGKAVRGAFWMILSGSGSRVIGILGTLAVTHYLAPEEYGEASLAALVIFIASTLSNGGLAQYIAARPQAGRDVVFHALVLYFGLGVLSIGPTLLLGPYLGHALHAPGITPLLPLIGVSAILDRVSTIQDRLQLRALRFRSVSVTRSLGELTYAAVSVGLAALAAGTPYGGARAIVFATVGRSLLRFVAFSLTMPRAEWLSPGKLSWPTARELLVAGAPLGVVVIAGMGASKLDNLVFQVNFGLVWLSCYNLAYNFAEMPGALVGEQVGDVLVPSFAHMADDEKRKDALLLSMRMMNLIVAPLAFGLAAVAPTLSKLAFPRNYQEGIIKVLQLLAAFSLARTITWVGNSYFQVRNRRRWIMILETARMVGIVVFMSLFIKIGMQKGPGHAVRWACASVVFVFSLSALSYMWSVRKLDGVRLRDQILPLVPPVIACLPMAAAVVGARRIITRFGLLIIGSPEIHGTVDQIRVFTPRLFVEILVGAVVFVPSALILAPRASRELIDLIRDAVRRRRGGGAEEAHAEAAAAGES